MKYSKLVIIWEFWGSVRPSGISENINDLIATLNKEYPDINVIKIQCPKIFTKFNKKVLNIIYILQEQFYVPLFSFFKKPLCTIYSSNSISFFSFFDNSYCIVNDLIPLEFSNKLSLFYYYSILSLKFHNFTNGLFITISQHSHKVICEKLKFRSGNIILLPCTFQHLINQNLPSIQSNTPASATKKYILLVSSGTFNKDLEGAVKLLSLNYSALDGYSIKILGLGGVISSSIKKLNERIEVEVLPFLSKDKVLEVYRGSSFVFFHSLAEGFGRPLIEARLFNKLILCSNLPVIAEIQDQGFFTYNNFDANSFRFALDKILDKIKKDNFSLVYNLSSISNIFSKNIGYLLNPKIILLYGGIGDTIMTIESIKNTDRVIFIASNTPSEVLDIFMHNSPIINIRNINNKFTFTNLCSLILFYLISIRFRMHDIFVISFSNFWNSLPFLRINILIPINASKSRVHAIRSLLYDN